MNRLEMNTLIGELKVLKNLEAFNNELFPELNAFHDLLVDKKITVFNDLSEEEIIQFYQINHKSENIMRIKDIKRAKRLNVKLDLIRDHLINSLQSIDSILKCYCKYCNCKYVVECEDNTKACFCFTHEEGCSCQKK